MTARPNRLRDHVRIVIVGSIVADTIEAADGSVTESLGGIAHTVSALAATAGGAYTIVPLCRVGEDCRARIESWAATLPGVSLEALIPMQQANPRVQLSYAAADRAGERVECLSHAPSPLTETDLEAAAGADLVVVNCITGTDCSAPAMRSLRAGCDRVYLDVHSLALGTAADGTRRYRGRDDWWSWFGCADVVQCNLAEAATICGLDPAAAGEAEATAAVEKLLQRTSADNDGPRGGCSGPGVWLLTLAAAGATVFDRRRGEAAVTHTPAPRIDVVDPTGAGDAFGAGYVCAWLRGAEPEEATRAAVHSGAVACGSAGVPSPAAFQKGLLSLI